MLLSGFTKRVIREGDLTIIDAAGRRHRVGDGRRRRVVIRLHDKALHHRLVIDPCLHGGEAYMDGTLTLEAQARTQARCGSVSHGARVARRDND